MNIDQKIKGELKKAYDAIRKGGGLIEVITAYELKDEDKKKIESSFDFMKSSSVIYTVDPEIMAGVIVKVGSKMIDLSLKSELTNLTHRLYESI